MNGKDIFVGLSYIDSRYIEEAEFGKLSAEEKAPVRVRSLRRPLLIAALVAVAMLLAGCAVAYVMHMQDVQIGSREVTQEVWDEAGAEFRGYENVTEQMLTLSGLKGSPSYEAAKEWFEFQNAYDPDGSIYEAHAKMDTHPKVDQDGFPVNSWADYDGYRIYTQEMADQVDALLLKYGLNKIGPKVKAQSDKALFAYLGIPGLLVEDSGAIAASRHSYYSEGGVFSSYFSFYFRDDRRNGWPYSVNCLYHLTPGTVFDPELCALADDGRWKQWNYQTASGDQVLILRSESQPCSWVFCQRADAMVSLRVEVIQAFGNTNAQGQDYWEQIPMTDRQLEQAVDAINWKLSPTPGDPALLNGPAVDTGSMSQTRNGVTITVKDVQTDGRAAIIRLGVTVPEGIAIPQDRLSGDSPTDMHWNRRFTSATSAAGYLNTMGGWIDGGDGDGRDNTSDSLFIAYCHGDDPDPFTPGDVWTLSIEDVTVTRRDHKEDILLEAPGTWKFDIPFDGSYDRRELEFVEEPFPTQVAVGLNDSVLMEQTLASLRLRRFGWSAEFRDSEYPGSLCDWDRQKFPWLVLKDGTKINMDDIWPGNAQPIDLDQVDHLILMDGTKLTPRWVE